jgi:hypothetical protein
MARRRGKQQANVLHIKPVSLREVLDFFVLRTSNNRAANTFFVDTNRAAVGAFGYTQISLSPLDCQVNN